MGNMFVLCGRSFRKSKTYVVRKIMNHDPEKDRQMKRQMRIKTKIRPAVIAALIRRNKG